MTKGKIDDTNVESQSELKSCFIITPIGGIGSDTFRKTDGLIKTVLEPILSGFGFRAVPAYEISSSGSITKQVIDHVINDELVIANLTGLNPNVMYELALRHAYKKKVVTMAENGTVLPFDISDQRTIFYEDNLYGSTVVKPLLKKYIQEALDTEVSSNPVIDSMREKAVISEGDEPDTTKYLLDRFDRLERLISSPPTNKFHFTNPENITDYIIMRLHFGEAFQKAIFMEGIESDAQRANIMISTIEYHERFVELSVLKFPESEIDYFMKSIQKKYKFRRLSIISNNT